MNIQNTYGRVFYIAWNEEGGVYVISEGRIDFSAKERVMPVKRVTELSRYDTTRLDGLLGKPRRYTICFKSTCGCMAFVFVLPIKGKRIACVHGGPENIHIRYEKLEDITIHSVDAASHLLNDVEWIRGEPEFLYQAEFERWLRVYHHQPLQAA